MTHVTVLRTLGPVLAKTWQSGGLIKDYDLAKQFKVRTVPVENIEALYALLDELQRDPQRCIIRGTPRAAIDGSPLPVERNLSNFHDEPSRLFMVDCDGFVPVLVDVDRATPEAAVEEFVSTLPTCFQGVSYVAQLSGSHGHPSKAGTLRCHVWFMLDQPLSCEQAEAWTAKWLPGADRTVHRAVQVNYTSAPVMEEGQVDPVALRLWLAGDLFDSVTIPPDMPVPEPGATRVARADRRNLVDPRGKSGVVGAVSRAYEPARIVDLFPEHFSEGSRPGRIHWVTGGGSREGISVCDSGQHLQCSQNSAPSSRAMNLFDFIRVFVFGHLDARVDQDVLDLDITAAPSYQATEAWAREQPEVQEQLTGPKAEAAAEAAVEAKWEVELSARDQVRALLDTYRVKIEAAADRDVLQLELGHNIARTKLFDDADREELAQLMQRKTTNLLGGRGLPISTVREWLEPVRLSRAFPDLDKQGEPQATLPNFEVLCGQLGVSIRYNIIKKELEIGCPTWPAVGADDRLNTVTTLLYSECQKAGLTRNLNTVINYAKAVGSKHSYNPVLDWIDERPWDGVSRIQALADTITCPEDQDMGLKYLMIRKWLIQCVAIGIGDDEKHDAARAILALQGKQNMGKSRWLLSLVPGRESLALDGAALQADNKDSIKLIISHWLVELAELEGTLRKSDMAALKAWVTKTKDKMRLPYAAAESEFKRRTSCFATVNRDDFLPANDEHTRFWVLRVVAMNHEHGIDMQQLWAEIAVLWRRGEPHWLVGDEMESVNRQTTEQHEVVDPLLELLTTEFLWDEPQEHWNNERNATQVCRDLSLPIESAGKMGKALAKAGAVQRRTAGRRFWMMPRRRGTYAANVALAA